MRTRSQVILVTVVVALTPVAAQEANDRYRTVPTDGGFLEIENQTGAVRECTRGATGYQCKPASPEALQSALGRLARENAELKERLAQARETPASRPQSPAPPAPLPSDEEVDRALGFMEKFLRRFMSIVREEKAERT
jgi:hypothetical protein